ncbi:NADP-dependent oxidoreductase [Proteiniclasticum ruminis]|uniref:NADP-dependent oxidoreductase n=1 Tax=Proteiniclasticum ruminis TaxID=398199 RepID=UPI00289A1D7B|nr:NADP-dependent oxidoreductase [Proteiniclasticum ruminis]
MEEMNVLAYTEFGPPEVLRPMKLPVPQPATGEILVKVKCASFNPSDALARKGVFQRIIDLTSPHVPGVDFSGLVVGKGPKAEKFQLGQSVYGYLNIRNNGSYAEYVVLPEEDAVPVPHGLTYEEAASIPLSYLTAYEALLKGDSLKNGQSVLLYGASGGVGLASIALAKMKKAAIYAVAGTQSLSLLEDKGVTRILDYKKEDILKEMPVKVDVLLNLAPLEKEKMTELLPLLKDHGTFVSTTGMPDPPEGSTLTFLAVQTQRSEENLLLITDLLNEKKIEPIKTSTWSITDAPLVHKMHEEGKLLGKAVFLINFR